MQPSRMSPKSCISFLVFYIVASGFNATFPENPMKSGSLLTEFRKTIKDKIFFPVCLVISQNQYLQVLTHFA